MVIMKRLMIVKFRGGFYFVGNICFVTIGVVLGLGFGF